MNPTRKHEITDPDGNVIRRGMAVVCGGDVWVVAHVAQSRYDWAVVLDRPRPDGSLKERMLIGRRRLRCVHVIGYQVPQVLR